MKGALKVFSKNTMNVQRWGKDTKVTLTKDGGKETLCTVTIIMVEVTMPLKMISNPACRFLVNGVERFDVCFTSML